jgi:hypothetical protein
MLFGYKDRDVFEPPTHRERILKSPLKYLITLVYKLLTRLRSSPPPSKPPIRVVCISDMHTHTYDIPAGDILVHAGDLTQAGDIAELQAGIDWLAGLPHTHKIAIAGNHDTFLDPRSRVTLPEADRNGSLDWKGVRYLQHSSVTLTLAGEHRGRRLNVYGAPQIPLCGGSSFAFQYARGMDAWSDTVPRDTDILVTHTPPKYHMDLSNPWLGCEFLLAEVWRFKPLLHVFGHVHADAGREVVFWDEAQKAYESGCAGRSKGIDKGVVSFKNWANLVKVAVYGVSGLVWDRIWGGEGKRTLMVNASLMVRNTGKLGNKVQVVHL